MSRNCFSITPVTLPQRFNIIPAGNYDMIALYIVIIVLALLVSLAFYEFRRS